RSAGVAIARCRNALRQMGGPICIPIASGSRADRACLERAGCSQSANGRLRNAVGARKMGLRGALREALHGLTALMGCERRRATKAHALRLRAGAAGASSGENQFALELGQAAEHR